MTSEQTMYLDENDVEVSGDWADQMEAVCGAILGRSLEREDWLLIQVAVLQDRSMQRAAAALSPAASSGSDDGSAA